MKMDIQNSKDRLDALEGTTITTINEQIASINNSISDLKQVDKDLDGYINTLEEIADDLQKQIDDAGAEITKVASELGEDMSALEQNLMNGLNTAKSAIEAELSAINLTLAELKGTDAELDKRITDLQAYVDNELSSAKDWANATFATLSQYAEIQTTVSVIRASIEQVNTAMISLETRLNGKIASDIKIAIDALRSELNADHTARIESAVNNLTVAYTTAVSAAKLEITTAYTNAISNAIIASEAGMKSWVNTRLSQSYYDIATIDGKLSVLAGQFDKTDSDLKKHIDDQQTALETAKKELTSAYKKAIEDAINNNHGIISAEIVNTVQSLETKINTRLSTIDSQITAIQKGISDIIDDIDSIYKQIEGINSILESLTNEDAELNSLIDKLESDYASVLQELDEIRPIDEISKKTIVDDIANIKTLIDTMLARLDACVLQEDFVSRIQSLKFIPEYSDRKVEMPEFSKSISLNFLISPSSQAIAIKNAWIKDKMVLTGYLQTTKSSETRAVSPAVSLTVTSVDADPDGELTVVMKEDSENPIDLDFFTGEKDAVVYIRISDGNSDVFSNLVDVESCVELSAYEDLSPFQNNVYQTANCYIVSKTGLYKFKAYKGVSQELAGYIDSDIHPKGKINHAKLLWETYGTDTAPQIGDLISFVGYDDEYVVFRTPDDFKEGNAVIAVRDDKGNILWSWHIWLTDVPEEHIYGNSSFIMMDRNLGATSSSPGDMMSMGLYYQRGRKDPFLGLAKIPTDVYEEPVLAKSTINRCGIDYDARTGSIEYLILNPHVFLSYSSKYDSDFGFFGVRNKDLWTPSLKTIYDPCPSGWRVPDREVFESADFSFVVHDDKNSGVFIGEFSAWYPHAGYLYDKQNMGEIAYACHLWTTYAYGNNFYNWSCDKYFAGIESHNSYSALSVRCVKEYK